MAPAAKHREKLIEAASALFRRQGYAATGLAEILAESGAPKGSLYHYFPAGKEAIGEAALRAAIEHDGARIGAMIARAPDPGAMLRSYAAYMADEMHHSGFVAGCPIATLALEAAPRSPRLTAASCAAFNLWSAALAGGLERAGIAAARAAELADFIISGFEGALILARVRQDTAPLRRAGEELARLVDTELDAIRSAQ